MAVENNSEVRGTTGKVKCLISAGPERDSQCTVLINVTFHVTVVVVETE